jgi:triosephosphate isomerase
MGLIRGVARTAVIAGTATAVSNRVSRRQTGRWAAQDAVAYEPQAAYGYGQPAAAPAMDMNTKIAQLTQLGELHKAGVLTDAEFELQKSQILNS